MFSYIVSWPTSTISFWNNSCKNYNLLIVTTSTLYYTTGVAYISNTFQLVGLTTPFFIAGRAQEKCPSRAKREHWKLDIWYYGLVVFVCGTLRSGQYTQTWVKKKLALLCGVSLPAAAAAAAPSHVILREREASSFVVRPMINCCSRQEGETKKKFQPVGWRPGSEPIIFFFSLSLSLEFFFLFSFPFFYYFRRTLVSRNFPASAEFFFLSLLFQRAPGSYLNLYTLTIRKALTDWLKEGKGSKSNSYWVSPS